MNKNSKVFPKVEISLKKINKNIDIITKLYAKKGIHISPVTKGVCGSIEIAKLFSRFDIHSIGDSHIQNIKRMKAAEVDAKFMLLRTPMRHEIEDVILYSDCCLISEISTITLLNTCAEKHNRNYNIILMIELGDLREGILPSKLDQCVKQIIEYKNIHLSGIGSNLACLNGIKPTMKNMDLLSSLAKKIKAKFSLKLDIISGGNSANYQWFIEANNIGWINHLRIGESILLGTDPISQTRINGLEHNAFVLCGEVIESKRKSSLPEGIATYTAFGNTPEIKDEGEMNRAILAVGLQDLDIQGCKPINKDIRIIGATSDHMIINSSNRLLKVGEIIKFNLKYSALLKIMVSPYVVKNYI